MFFVVSTWTSPNGFSRSMGFPRNDWSKKSQNCLGYEARETGHKRVPLPPERITGTIDVSLLTHAKQTKGNTMKTIPFIDLKAQYQALREPINKQIQTVLEHGQFIMGPEVEELERRLAKFTGVKHAIACSSGTDAAIMAMMAMRSEERRVG